MKVQALLQTMGAAWTDDVYIASVATTAKEMSFENCIVEKEWRDRRKCLFFFFSCGYVLVWFGWLMMKMKVKMEMKEWQSSMLIYPFSSFSTSSVTLAPTRTTLPVPDVDTYYSNTANPHRNQGQASVDSQRIPNFSPLSHSPPRPSFLLIPLEPSSLRCAFTWRIG